MNAKEIREKKFDKGFNGYKIDEVDDYLSEVSIAYTNLLNENSELEKKLEVLADKIREYRKDEEALKEALLGAQKQGNLAISEAKQKAKQIVDEAVEEKENILLKANEEKQKIDLECESALEQAKHKSAKILDEANERAKVVESELKQQIDTQREILHRTKDEAAEFKNRLLAAFRKMETEIKEIPEKCENEFVTKTLYDYKKNRDLEKREINLTRQEPAKVAEPAVKVTPIVEEPVPDAASVSTDTSVFVAELENSRENEAAEGFDMSPMFEEAAEEPMEDFKIEKRARRDAPMKQSSGDREWQPSAARGGQKREHRDGPRLQFGSNSQKR